MTGINHDSFEKFLTLNTSSKPGAQQELVHMSQTNPLEPMVEGDNSFLVNLLSKRQADPPFTTSQGLHSQNNIDQLVGGEG